MSSLAQAGLFLAIVLGVIAGLHYYLWRRLVRDTFRTPKAKRIGWWVIWGLAALLVATMLSGWILPVRVEWVLAWPGYLWLALMFYLFVVLLALEIPVRLVRLAWPRSRDRRRLLARGMAIGAGLIAAGAVGYGVPVALGPPRIRRVDIPLFRLPGASDGLRVALVADLHLGPLLGRGHTERVVDMINGLDADVVAIVGDLVDGSVGQLASAAAPLTRLRSRHGVFFVTGNHEYYSGYEPWVEHLGELGLRVLRNERVELPGGVDLAGINDVTGEEYGDGPDLAAALAGRDPARPVVLLAHQPVLARESARAGVDLQLSGHTHGGQMYPFQFVVSWSGQPVVSGLGRVDGMPVFVTNGAGFWGPPVRVGAPPEITLVQLRATQR